MATPYPLARPTEIAHYTFLLAKSIAVIGNAGKAALKAADVCKKPDGILAVDPKGVATVLDAFEEFLKQLKFLRRYELDS